MLLSWLWKFDQIWKLFGPGNAFEQLILTKVLESKY